MAFWEGGSKLSGIDPTFRFTVSPDAAFPPNCSSRSYASPRTSISGSQSGEIDHCRAISIGSCFPPAYSEADSEYDSSSPRALKESLELDSIDENSLEKRTRKKSYVISARDLVIIWSNDSSYWRWKRIPESRFTLFVWESKRYSEVAELIRVCWLEIRCNISTTMLSKDTVYVAYLVFKLTGRAFGWDYPAEILFNFVGNESTKGIAYLKQEGSIWPSQVTRGRSECQYPKERADGWWEIKLGEFHNMGDDGNDNVVEMSLKQTRHLNWKGGLLVRGIEIKPQQGQ